MATTHPPALLSTSRIITLLGSVLVALSSGTNYVSSAYAPQLGARLHLSHTQLNVIGLAGNMGVYSSGPIWGRIVDGRGPRIPLIGAFGFLLMGYIGIKRVFDVGVPSNDISISIFSIIILVVCGFMTGLGGNAGLASAINTTAKSFPDKARASTTGLVLSGFGLSAFYFSTIANTAFPGDTSSFLLVLAFGTALPMVIGFFIVRPIPLPSSEKVSSLEDGTNEHGYRPVPNVESSPVFSGNNDSQTRLLTQAHNVEDNSLLPRHEYDESVASGYLAPQTSDAVEMSGNSSVSARRRDSRGSAHRSIRDLVSGDSFPNIYGKQLWMTADFWLIFTIMSLLSGTGIMYINNVGSISQALYAEGSPSYDEVEASRWQAAQVSTISIGNFLGRVLIGLISDFTKGRLGLPRSYCLFIVSTLFVISQIAAINVFDVAHLWRASALLGVAYGSLFGLCPTIVIEWFGLAHLSENWGYVSLSPLVGGNLFSLAFGRNLDAHAPHDTLTSRVASIVRRELPSDHQCFDGRDCYVTSLNMTVAACLFALILSVWAGWRDRQKAGMAVKGRSPEVVWEDAED
ncbi:hypothetical protein SERLA73DRAFT_191271 [Serpula lacrymans var. lacrymans S7.3]|uniref:Nodulin-like domain-containing protein n=2 Tax=Serpula lacrymans var. lacrymans TaxID=341189 RepID=F8QH70_SERL3|nr:uncharacterized protein SERLADRAFT_459884 [Serpula lacrymans var. lacrymans S7.9]EGN92319.1 hypothetical protein SERLA73DRAFT_191271 [Serpula lacrymans var. lacrymans S7.3]EGO27074.1 hypothetical protein SERLADRAFT_459884 [Serpula lacrymans var. lacrymans S7.9]